MQQNTSQMITREILGRAIPMQCTALTLGHILLESRQQVDEQHHTTITNSTSTVQHFSIGPSPHNLRKQNTTTAKESARLTTKAAGCTIIIGSPGMQGCCQLPPDSTPDQGDATPGVLMCSQLGSIHGNKPYWSCPPANQLLFSNNKPVDMLPSYPLPCP